jgi:hypothetical protein
MSQHAHTLACTCYSGGFTHVTGAGWRGVRCRLGPLEFGG